MKVLRSNRGGFTLIEMLLVVVIIGVLAAMIIPNYVGRSNEARHKAAWGDMAVLKTQVGIFELDHGRFPGDLGELISPPGPQKYLQPDEDLLDPWGEQYIYSASGDSFRISYSHEAEGEQYKP